MLLKGFVEDFRRASYLSFNNFDEYVMIKLDKNDEGDNSSSKNRLSTG